MPPPRPRSIGCNTGIAPVRPNPNTPMSERQQMALLMQMTSSSDNTRVSQKCKEYKKEEDANEFQIVEKFDLKDKLEDASFETKKDSNFDLIPAPETSSSNVMKRNYSDIDEEDCDDAEDIKKKRRKDLDTGKDTKTVNSTLRFPNRLDKNFKQINSTKTSLVMSKTTNVCEKEDGFKSKPQDADIDDEDSKNDSLCSGGLKVPPLKIVIPQQNCTIDAEGGGSRAGKLNTTRNAALPYVVSSNTESSDRDLSVPNTSPHDSPIKINHTCLTDDKSCKLLNEEKNLRVLRSAHRVGLTTNDRNSNNSSPQISSNSPSPASSSANDPVEGKMAYVNSSGSPPHQNISYEPDGISNIPSPSTSSTSSSKDVLTNNVELHPRKRKIRAKTEEVKSTTGSSDIVLCSDSHPHDLPFTNCFQMYMNIRKQVEKKWRNVLPVKPRAPQGFNEYLSNTRNYLLQSNQNIPVSNLPKTISTQMKDIYLIQERDRVELHRRHLVEKEKLCLNVEQEIIRIHSKAARNMACQSLSFSVCSYMKDDEVYNILSNEQEDKERNARSRFNGRLLLSWLQDVDDKWEKIKESMVLRHHNEAESLHAVQVMDWESALKKFELLDLDNQPCIDSEHVPIVHVSDDFDLLPA
ncbi:uncharacterized protein LOC106088933 [Stomoxys calcitrans]|uniref:uncharacterized protein LOC106088933 n=1 Tax=Stomoxys calcitrans TaxID=35570 RepID=UPI0027E2CC67|nr:uncharacterized protein LOC106088933 [Stomoxys calcitrans]